MLEPQGRQLLGILGKLEHSPQRGILQPAEMPTALAALEAAIAKDEAEQAQREQLARDEGLPLPKSEGVSLRHRVLPFIEMIKRCQKADKEIVWGV